MHGLNITVVEDRMQFFGHCLQRNVPDFMANHPQSRIALPQVIVIHYHLLLLALRLIGVVAGHRLVFLCLVYGGFGPNIIRET